MKLKSLKFLENLSKKLKKKKKKIVLCHGDFDMLHLGHIKHFKAAKKFGDILIVSVTNKKFIKKGFNRPILNNNERLEFLSEISTIDFLYLDNNTTATKVISILKPNYYVKGSDYKTDGDPN